MLCCGSSWTRGEPGWREGAAARVLPRHAMPCNPPSKLAALAPEASQLASLQTPSYVCPDRLPMPTDKPGCLCSNRLAQGEHCGARGGEPQGDECRGGGARGAAQPSGGLGAHCAGGGVTEAGRRSEAAGRHRAPGRAVCALARFGAREEGGDGGPASEPPGVYAAQRAPASASCALG